MPILNKLIALYETRGFQVSTGLSPSDFNGYELAPFTWLIEDGKSYTNGLGIGMQEVYFLECLFADYHPKNILVIGNSFGWSTFALALINPSAKIVALDAGFDKNSLAGLDFTRRVAAEEGLNITAIRGVSPGDVPNAVSAFGGEIDFAFIDGNHTNEQIVLDYKAVRDCAAPDSVYLFHDVRMLGLMSGFGNVERAAGQTGQILSGTTSGMGILYDTSQPHPIDATVRNFSDKDQAVAAIRRGEWRLRHRRRLKYRKILTKRVNWVRRKFGKEPLPLP